MFSKGLMETETEIKTVKAIVEYLLLTDERCRNDDKWLTFRVMQHFTKIFIPFEDFQKIPAFETVKRCRAYIQNVEKRYIPTDPLIVKRRKRQQTFRDINKLMEVKQ